MTKYQSRFLNIPIFILIFTIASADSETDFKNAQRYIQETKLQSDLENISVHPSIVIDIPKNPEEEKYYKNPDEMDRVSNSSIGGFDDIKTIAQNTNTININEASDEVKHVEEISSNADDIISGTYKDCNKQEVLEKENYLATCETSHFYKATCLKNLEKVKRNHTELVRQRYSFDEFDAGGKHDLSVQLPAESGTIRSIRLSISSINFRYLCNYNYSILINKQEAALYSSTCQNKSETITFTKDNLNISFNSGIIKIELKNPKILGKINGHIEYEFIKEVEEYDTDWQTSCDNEVSSCPIISSKCLERKEVKTIDGGQAGEQCVKISEIHQCGHEDSFDCEKLKDKGCFQISTQCISTKNGRCSTFKDTWSCSNEHVIGHKLVCGENIYCADGSCQQRIHEENNEIGKSLSDLSAAQQVGTEFQNNSGSTSSIFAGVPSECSIDALNVVDCCKNSGWGKDLLAKCTNREKELAAAKEKGLAIYIGKYCHNKDAGICLEYRKTYCVFQNKIAFDVQSQGRKKQLGKSFGSSERPDCSGLSVHDITSIDFDKIDFRNIEKEIKDKFRIPNNEDQLNITGKLYKKEYENKNT